MQQVFTLIYVSLRSALQEVLLGVNWFVEHIAIVSRTSYPYQPRSTTLRLHYFTQQLLGHDSKVTKTVLGKWAKLFELVEFRKYNVNFS